MIEAALFDLGDTLVHFQTVKIARIVPTLARPGYDRAVELGYAMPSFVRYVRAVKVAFAVEWVRSKLTRREIRLRQVVQRIHRNLGANIPEEVYADIGRRCMVPAMDRLASVDAEALGLLRSLKTAGLKLGLVSNTTFPAFAIDEYLAGVGLLDAFPVRVYSSEVAYMKPDRRIFEIALDRISAAARHVAFIGDRLDKDIAGAARVKMKTVLFLHGQNARSSRVRPDGIIRRLSELPAILAQW